MEIQFPLYSQTLLSSAKFTSILFIFLSYEGLLSSNQFEERLKLIGMLFISQDRINERHRMNNTGTRAVIRVEAFIS
jgi:hypothetical protein